MITVVGAFVVLAVWLAGPQFLAAQAEAEGRTVTATVTRATPCGQPGGTETVRFSQNGKQRVAEYNACGHRPGERREVTVPADSGGGKLQVHDADAAFGQGEMLRPVSLLLLALSCVGGGLYVHLMQRTPRVVPRLT